MDIGVFGKLKEKAEEFAIRQGMRSGGLVCPNCAAAMDETPASFDEVMGCDKCGTKASAREWIAAGQGVRMNGRADLPPPDTKIRKEGDGWGGVVWHIPAGGKFGFFLFFSLFWLAITGLVSGGFLFAFLSGQKIEGDMPGWVIIPFFGIFWAIGLGMIYAAFREKFMRCRVSVTGGEVTLRKEMFGRGKEKSLRQDDVKSVSQKEFYQKNYQPVFGIEIRGEKGKLRFGSVLTEAEKAGLVADVKEAILGPTVLEVRNGVLGEKLGERKEVFSVAVPSSQKQMLPMSLAFTLMGAGFVCLGIFVMKDEGFFRWFWTGFSSLFLISGLLMLFKMIRSAGSELRIEGNSSEVSIRTYKRGLVLKDRSFPRREVSGIRSTVSGSSGATQMKRVELIVGVKAEKISAWMDGYDADEMVKLLRGALGL